MKTTNISGIYIITNNIDDRVYIGSAVSLAHRKGVHFYHLRENKHGNQHLQNFANKYGIESLKFDVLEFCEKEILIEREQFYFSKFDNKFNIVEFAGSTLGRTHSDITRKKISDAVKNANLKGIPKSEKTKSLMRKPKSKEHALNIKKAQKDVIKTVYQYDFNLNLIRVYESISESAKNTGFNRQQISHCCNETKQKSVKGFIFTFCKIDASNKNHYLENIKNTIKNSKYDIKKIRE